MNNGGEPTERVVAEKQAIFTKQRKRYTALLQEFGKTLQ